MRGTAVALLSDRKAGLELWNKTGEAVEYALKAYIQKHASLDRWPSKKDRPDLHTHDLRKLCEVAGISLEGQPSSIRAAFKTVFEWDRSHAYTSSKVPRAEARAIFDAAFGPEGVIEWLKNH